MFFLIALVFVYRSFYGMRIPEDKVIPLLPVDDDEPPMAAKKVYLATDGPSSTRSGSEIRSADTGALRN